MSPKKRQAILLILLILALFTINYQILDSKLEQIFSEQESFQVLSITDGDTVFLRDENLI